MRHSFALRIAGLATGFALAFAAGASPASAGTIHVTTTSDVVAADGLCSLREAVNSANDNALTNASGCITAGSSSTYDQIIVPAGTYTLSNGGTDDSNAAGDLDVTGNLTITGAAAATTIIKGAGDRVMDVQPNASAFIESVTIRDGSTPDGADGVTPTTSGGTAANGGGIRNAGDLVLDDAVVTGNKTGDGGTGGPRGTGGAAGSGAGIASPGRLTLIDSTVSGNIAGNGGDGGPSAVGGDGGNGGGGGAGAGILATGGLALVRTTIENNTAGHGGLGGHESPGVAGAGGNGGPGGGIIATRNVVLDDSVVRGNQAGDGGDGGSGASIASDGGTGGVGGGVDVAEFGSSLEVSGTTISGNSAGDGGKGYSSPTGDGAFGGTGGDGGGILAAGLAAHFVASRIVGNTAGAGGQAGVGPGGNGFGGPGGVGGGLNLLVGSATLSQTTVADNRAGRGGDGGVPTAVMNDTLAGSGGGGGGMTTQSVVALGDGTVAIDASTFSGNHAGDGGDGHAGGGSGARGGLAGAGGGLVNVGPVMTVTNSTFSGNGAGDGGDAIGGGTAGDGGSAGGLGSVTDITIRSATIAANKAGSAGAGTTPGAAGSGGGLFTSGNPGAIENTIVASNDGGNCTGAFTDLGHNIDFPGSACPGTDADPKLGALADNGGPTMTRAIGTDGAAFDQVPSTGAGCLATDQRGQTRPKGAACDIGAFEAEPPTAPSGGGGGGGNGGGGTGGAPPPGGTQQPGGTQPGGVTTAALSIKLVLAKQKLGTALSKGYLAQFKTNQASTGVIEVFVEGTDARGLKAAAAKKVRVAKGSRKVTKAGQVIVTAKFTRKAKAVLRKRKKVTLLVQLTVTNAKGVKSVKTAHVALKR